MKKTVLLVGLVVLVLSSCGKNASSKLNYESRTLGGTVSGSNWEYAFGRMERDFFSPGFSFEITDVAPQSDSCFVLDQDVASILFYVEENELVTGVDYELSFGSDSRTVTAYDGETNFIVTTGKYRFDSIDTVNTNTLTGKMVLSSEDDVEINGEFQLYYCK